jgi:hypothetical protein
MLFHYFPGICIDFQPCRCHLQGVGVDFVTPKETAYIVEVDNPTLILLVAPLHRIRELRNNQNLKMNITLPLDNFQPDLPSSFLRTIASSTMFEFCKFKLNSITSGQGRAL